VPVKWLITSGVRKFCLGSEIKGMGTDVTSGVWGQWRNVPHHVKREGNCPDGRNVRGNMPREAMSGSLEITRAGEMTGGICPRGNVQGEMSYTLDLTAVVSKRASLVIFMANLHVVCTPDSRKKSASNKRRHHRKERFETGGHDAWQLLAPCQQ